MDSTVDYGLLFLGSSKVVDSNSILIELNYNNPTYREIVLGVYDVDDNIVYSTQTIKSDEDNQVITFGNLDESTDYEIGYYSPENGTFVSGSDMSIASNQVVSESTTEAIALEEEPEIYESYIYASDVDEYQFHVAIDYNTATSIEFDIELFNTTYELISDYSWTITKEEYRLEEDSHLGVDKLLNDPMISLEDFSHGEITYSYEDGEGKSNDGIYEIEDSSGNGYIQEPGYSERMLKELEQGNSGYLYGLSSILSILLISIIITTIFSVVLVNRKRRVK